MTCCVFHCGHLLGACSVRDVPCHVHTRLHTIVHHTSHRDFLCCAVVCRALVVSVVYAVGTLSSATSTPRVWRSSTRSAPSTYHPTEWDRCAALAALFGGGGRGNVVYPLGQEGDLLYQPVLPNGVGGLCRLARSVCACVRVPVAGRVCPFCVRGGGQREVEEVVCVAKGFKGEFGVHGMR